MARIAIVTKDHTMPGAIALEAAFRKVKGCELDVISLNEGMCVQPIDTADMVVYRVSTQTYLKYKNDVLPRIKNKTHAELLSRTLVAFDKASQSAILHSHQIPTPLTRVVHSISSLADDVPCVIKEPIGNQGGGVYLVRSRYDLKRVAKSVIEKHGNCIQQEYIQIEPATDKRLFVVGVKVVASMCRRSVDAEFRANIHLGGVGEAYIPTERELELAINTAKAFKVPFCGVDIIDSPRGPLVLEINPSPGFAISSVTGIPVVEMIVQYYSELIEGK